MISVEGVTLDKESRTLTIFPDRTTQVWRLPEEILAKKTAIVTWEFFSEDEFMHLAQLKVLLDANNITSELIISYLPYARQDKKISNETTFALYPFAMLLNSLKFSKISIVDPHSREAIRIISNSVAIYPKDEIEEALKITEADIVCYPDSGAYFKYMLEYRYAYVQGYKVRDPKTGHILSCSISGNVKNKIVLILDDICDGGATFILLTKALLADDAKEVHLFVTHGIFSKGLRPLYAAGLGRIFTRKGEFSEIHDELTYKPFKINKATNPLTTKDQ